MNTKTVIGIIVVLVILAGGYYLLQSDSQPGVGGGAATESTQEGTQTGVAGPGAMPEAERAVGEWQSADDPKFRREFRADGSLVDTYEGNASATMSGTWMQVSDVEAEGVELPAVGDATILKLMLDGEPFYVAISTDTTEDTLVLINLSGRGGVQTFTRVN